MILVKNRGIIGLVTRIITGILKFIYRLIALLNLQLTLLIGLIGLIIFLCGGFDDNGIAVTVLCVAVAISIVYAVIATVKKLLGFDKKKSKKRERSVPQIVKSDNEFKISQTSDNINEIVQAPKYFRVKQNSNYIMAEYHDRYELFYVQNGKMKKIRTDYKGN